MDLMSSSFPAARFPTLPLSKEKEASVEPIYKDTRAPAEEPSDEALIARICNDDNEALALLFRRYARMVWSIAERILRNEAEADDLVQDVFLLISRRASVFDSSKGTARSLIALMTYQRSFTRRRYLNARHCQAPVAAEERAANAAAPSVPFYDQSIEAHFGRERLRKALEEMSEDQRETLRLYFFEGYTLGEIAAQFGQSAGNVKHHLYRGLDKLRRNMPKLGYRDEGLGDRARK
jgi:RNA polymerase sigma-70 factor, ECF subfamily